MAMVPSVFLSAASDEFKDLREWLHLEVDKLDWKVWSQTNLTELSEATLEKLDDHIRRCDCVVHLVGHREGSRPRKASLQWLRKTFQARMARRYPALLAFVASRDNTLTLTQWEAWLALLRGSSLLVMRPEHWSGPPDASQLVHLGLLDEEEVRCETFSDRATLLAELTKKLHRVAEKLAERDAASRRRPLASRRKPRQARPDRDKAFATPKRLLQAPRVLPTEDRLRWQLSLPSGAYRERKSSGFVGREWLFDRIEAWAVGSGTPMRPLLVLGRFGVGKTAAMAKLLERWVDRRVAFHFCKYDSDDTLQPGQILRHLATQLAVLIDDYRSMLDAEPALQNLLSRADEDPLAALNYALIEPLNRIVDIGPAQRCFVIIEAIDESREIGAAPGAPGTSLLDLLASASGRLPRWLRLLVTSRPVSRLTADDDRVHERFDVLDLDRQGVVESNADVRRYVLQRARAEPSIADFVRRSGRSAEALLEVLWQRGEDHFLLVTSVLDSIARGDIPVERIGSLPGSMPAFYRESFDLRVMERRLDRERVLEVLALIAELREPLPSTVIAAILGLAVTEVEGICEAFGGLLVLTPNRGVTFAHVSMEFWLRGRSEAPLTEPQPCLIDAGKARECLVASVRAAVSEGLAGSGEFRRYLELWGVTLLVDAGQFGPALTLLMALRIETGGESAPRYAEVQHLREQADLVVEGLDSQWTQVDAAIGPSHDALRAALRHIEAGPLVDMLRKRDYEAGKYVPVIRTLIEFHAAVWPAILAELLDPGVNDIVFRYDAGVAYALAWGAAAGELKERLLNAVDAMIGDPSSADLRELAGYAFKYICERSDRQRWWGAILPRLRTLAQGFVRTGNTFDRMVAGELMLALAIQRVPVNTWFDDKQHQPSFWQPIWDNNLTDVSAIHVALDLEDMPGGADERVRRSLAQARAMDTQAELLRKRLHGSDFFRLGGAGARFAPMLSSFASMQDAADAYDRQAVEAFARALQGRQRDDVLDFIRLQMLHPLWNVSERAAALVAEVVRLEPGLKTLFDLLLDVDPALWRIRYGAVDAAFNHGSQDNFEAFFRLLLRCGGDASCRVRGICVDDLTGWMRDADAAAVEDRLADPKLQELIRTWLAEADDIWLLEYLHELFRLLSGQRGWSDRRIGELMGGPPPLLSRYLGDADFYLLPLEEFMRRAEGLRLRELQSAGPA